MHVLANRILETAKLGEPDAGKFALGIHYLGSSFSSAFFPPFSLPLREISMVVGLWRPFVAPPVLPVRGSSNASSSSLLLSDRALSLFLLQVLLLYCDLRNEEPSAGLLVRTDESAGTSN